VIVSIDGAIVPPEQAAISVFDRGLLYGDGLFEVVRTLRGRPVWLDDHLARLCGSARELQLAVPRDLAPWVRTAIAAAGPGDHRVRVVVTRGQGPIGARLATLGPGRTIVIVEPLPAQPRELSLAIIDWRLPRRAGPAHKTLAYLDHALARELAAAAGADEAVRLDADGNAAECATANLFAVLAGAVVTPPVVGILPGVTRARVLALAAQLAIPAHERAIAVPELRGADEIFATSTLRGVTAVTRLDGVALSAGPITRRLTEAYSHSMQAEI
jgi:branched-chain amino acid aminotransferase